MWVPRLSVPLPLLNDDPWFSQAIEDLSVQEFITGPDIEALAIFVLPWCPRSDVGSLGTDGFDLLPDSIRNGLGSVIRADVCQNTLNGEQVGKGINHIRRVELPLYPNGQAFANELIDDGQCSF